ncbi:hypothetical protein KMP13_17870 [Epibacterium ulvae]|uniref:hypothetical protein n=1 Tax=Epibacterium ulvae TaxID=1156985 RepID=UPI001BFC6738|nr:hypothetical protein [Epibacterium ulvae]MBT8155697.1 hypothetical protein [Epibacterium ulvae]
MRLISFAFLSVLLATSACGPSYTKAVDTDKVVVDIRGGESIKGRYDPAGFSTKDAHKMAASICKHDTLASYSEAAVDGQIIFDVRCKNGNKYGENAGVLFKRAGSEAVLVVATFSVNDTLLQTKDQLSL